MGLYRLGGSANHLVERHDLLTRQAVMTDDEFRWAEALALDSKLGAGAALLVAQRMGELYLAQDVEGMIRLRQIAEKLEALLKMRHSPQ